MFSRVLQQCLMVPMLLRYKQEGGENERHVECKFYRTIEVSAIQVSFGNQSYHFKLPSSLAHVVADSNVSLHPTYFAAAPHRTIGFVGVVARNKGLFPQ